MSQAACRKLASIAALAGRLSLKQFTPRLFPPFPTPLSGVPEGIGLPPFARVWLLPGVVVVPVVGLPPGVTVGVLVAVVVGVLETPGVGDTVAVGVVVGVDVSVGVTTTVGVSVGVVVGVDVAVGVGVTPTVGVFAGRVGVGDGVGEGLEGVMVTTGVGVRDG